jgi:hydroxypyruvate reductase
VLVNVGRGPIIDQAALIRALQDGTIAAAGLDVLEGEPKVPPELATLQNVVITPHIASVTRRATEMLGETLVDNLAAHFAGRPIPGEVPLA